MIVSSKSLGEVILMNTSGNKEKEVPISVGVDLMGFLNQN